MVGLGGCSTGEGLFTLKPLRAEEWVCAYAPTAPFQVLTTGQVDQAGDYFLTNTWRGKNIGVDGRKCSLGLGKMINDGKPFSKTIIFSIETS